MRRLKARLRRLPLVLPVYRWLRLHLFVRPTSPAAYRRLRYQAVVQRAQGFVSRHHARPFCTTEDGEIYLRTTDGFFVFYNLAEDDRTFGDGQSLDLAADTRNRPLEDVLLDTLPDDAVYVDVGANNGYYYSLKVARRHPRCRVYAFEPDPAILPHLERNVRFNALDDRITIVPRALGEREGRVRLTAGLGASGYVVVDDRGGLPTIEVVATTLDRFADDAGLTRLDALKIDVEGGELGCLRGAAGVLRRWHPLVILELNERLLRRSGASVAAVAAFLEALGYAVHRVVGGHDAIAVPAGRGDVLAAGPAGWLAPGER